MGNFSRDTFDRLKHYVGVRLQQGVPLIDADWNELEDIRKYEVQAFLKWFVGNGVPEGNNGFQIQALAGGGENTLVLTANTPAPGLSSVSVNRAASTAADALGFGLDNSAVTRSGSSPARLTGDATEPFVLAAGMTLTFSADGQVEETVTFQAADFATIGAATAAEVAAAINAVAIGLTASAGTGNDLEIEGGDGTAEGAGRCLVDGKDAIIESRLKYTAQPLYDNADLALLWGVAALPPLAPPTLPAVERTDTAYLDVWEREVTAAEDGDLINPLVGMESATRVKREWVVRVREGGGVPLPGDADHAAGHNYYALATLRRRNDDPSINLVDVQDQRESRLLMPPATLVTDLFGVSSTDYRRGVGRPPISLREAINALLRGELPSTPDTAIAPDPGLDVMRHGFLFDNALGIIAVWYSDRVAATDQVYAARLDTVAFADAGAGFGDPPVPVTAGAGHNEPHAALLPNGDLVVAYQTGFGAASDVFFKRAPLAQLTAATEEEVAATAGTAEASPFVVVSGDLVTFLYHQGTPTNRWLFRRYRYTDDTWADASAIILSTDNAPQRDLHAARDAAGDVWVAFRGVNNVHVLRLRPSTATVSQVAMFDSGAGVDDQPFVLATPSGDVWVFWRSPAALHYTRFTNGAWEGVQSASMWAAGDRQPTAVEDADGGIWLFWVRGAVGSGDIYFARRNPATGGWGAERQMTVSTGDDSAPFALIGADNAIWTFWSSDRDGNVNLYFKRLVTAL